MFGMGFGELVVIFLIALIFLGPEKIPSTARSLGRWLHEIRSAWEDTRSSFEKDLDDNRREIRNSVSPPPPPPKDPA